MVLFWFKNSENRLTQSARSIFLTKTLISNVLLELRGFNISCFITLSLKLFNLKS